MTAAGQDRLDRAAAALRPHLPATSDDELRALARVVLAAAEPAGQDGERLVTEIERVLADFIRIPDNAAIAATRVIRAVHQRPVSAVPIHVDAMLVEQAESAERQWYLDTYSTAPIDVDPRRTEAMLAAVAPDIAAGVEERVRRECAEELRAEVVRSGNVGVVGSIRLTALADRWSSSGRAPAGEEEQR